MSKKPAPLEPGAERVIVNMPPHLIAAIEDYRRVAPSGIPSKSDAIRDLIEAGAKALGVIAKESKK